MANNKINIVLSTYNSIEDLHLNIDIFKHNFKHNYNIIASINDEKTLKQAEKLEGLDSAVLGSKIPLNGSFPYARLHARVYDSLRSCFFEASKFNAKYSIHNHADAIFLKEDKLTEVIQKMNSQGKMAAVRGRGFGWYYKYSAIGMIDDHFLFIDNELIKQQQIFKQEAMELLPTRNNIHGILAMFVLSNIGLKNTFFHTDVNNLVYWDNAKVNMLANYMRPMSLDSDFGFLHINKNSFLHNHAKQLLAHYLYSHNLKKGKYIEYILDTFLTDKDKLFSELKELELYQNKLLKRYLYDDSEINHREFSHKKNLISNGSTSLILKNTFKKLKKLANKTLCKQHPIDNRLYFESLREKRLDEYYKFHFKDLHEDLSFIDQNFIM